MVTRVVFCNSFDSTRDLKVPARSVLIWAQHSAV